MIFDSASAMLMAMFVTATLIFFYIRGAFGWTGNPAAWGVFMRAIERLIRKKIETPLDIYCDDLMALGATAYAYSDQQIAQDLVRKTLNNESAINMGKSIAPSPAADILGGWISLKTESVRVNNKGIDKLLYTFFCIDNRKDMKHHKKVFEILAGVAMRYSRFLPFMSPFTSSFFIQMRRFSNNSAKHTMNSNCRFCIEIWRVVAVCLYIDRNSLRIPLRSLVDHSNAGLDVISITDASPWGLCVMLFHPLYHGLHLGYAYLHLPYDPWDGNNEILPEGPIKQRALKYGDSSLQNNREFNSHILNMIVIHKFIPPSSPTRPRQVHWIGDNISSLKWARTHRCNSPSAFYANMADAWLRIHTRFELTSTEHIAGASVRMGPVDKISRKIATPEIDSKLKFDVASDTNIRDLFLLFDPLRPQTNIPDHRSTFTSLHSIMHKILPNSKHTYIFDQE